MTDTKTQICGTRGRINAKRIQEVAPRILPTPEPDDGFASVVPARTLAQVHSKTWSKPEGMPSDVADELRSIDFGEKLAKLKTPLFSGTLVFVHLVYTVHGEANPFSVSLADTATAIDFVRRALIPISQYASQYGPNNVVVKPDPLEAPVVIKTKKYSDATLRDWIKTIVAQNNLDTKRTALIFLNPPGITNTAGDPNEGTGGYHDMGEVPYAFVNVSGSGFTLDDNKWQFAAHLSHEIAEMIVDPKPNGNPEVCDQCGPNCALLWINYFTRDSVYIATSQAFPPPFEYGFLINGIVKPAFAAACPPALSVANQQAACSYGPPAFPLGMTSITAPSSAGRAGNLFVFAVAPNNRILFNQIAPGGTWVGVQEIPGGFVTNMAVAAGMQGDTLFVFATDPAGQLHFTQAPEGGAFSAWQVVPGAPKTPLAVATAGRPGNLFVFLVEANGQIAFNQIAPGGNFVGWQQMPGGMTTPLPVAAGMEGTTLFVFAKDAVGQLHFTQAPQGGAFAPWAQVPGSLATVVSPTAVGREGTLFVFARKADGTIAFNQVSAGKPFVGWQTIPGGFETGVPVGAGMQGTYASGDPVLPRTP